MEAIAKAELEPAKSGAPQPFKPAQRGPESRVPRDCNDLLEFRELESPRTSFLLRIGLRAPKFFWACSRQVRSPVSLASQPRRGPESQVPWDDNDLLEFAELESPRTVFLFRIGRWGEKFFVLKTFIYYKIYIFIRYGVINYVYRWYIWIKSR